MSGVMGGFERGLDSARRPSLLRLRSGQAFVSAKGLKTMLAVPWPFGCPARFTATGSGQTRLAQTLPPFLRSRLHCSARPCHQARESKKEVEITAQGSGKGRQLIGASLPRPSGRRWAIGEDFFRGSMKKSDMRQDCRNGGEGKGC
jgi:hypothetical protein